jgi:integrase/recombinase XerD
MLEDMRMRKFEHTQDLLHPRRAQALPSSSDARLTPPRPRTCAASSCIWSTPAPAPVTINATLTGLKFFFDITLGRGEVMPR